MPSRRPGFLRDDCGQDMVEYALLVAVIAITGGLAVIPITPHINVIYSKIVSVLAKHS
jgi:Flp pilus assembly pilin Flp